MFVMYLPVLASSALVGFFTDSAKAAGISNARLFGQSEVFEPTRDLLGHPSYPAQRVQDVDHCENAELFLPGKRLVALDNNVSQLETPRNIYCQQSLINDHYASIIRGFSYPSAPTRMMKKVPVPY